MKNESAAISHCINIPKGATNGEALCTLFPNLRYTLSDKSQRLITTIGVASSFDMDWWNAPYEETKIDFLCRPMWIHVGKRLPEEDMAVIGITEFDDIYKAELYDDCGEKKWYADGNFDVPIVAWMPMPELHKVESED